MAVDISYDGEWILITFAGAITAADLTAVIHHVIDLEGRLAVTPDRLVDLGPSTTTLAIGYSDISNVVQARRAAAPPNPIRTAVIAHSAVQQGYARMFQTLNDHPLVTIAVFSDRADAETWLHEPRGPQ
jgi:hypothetical protein